MPAMRPMAARRCARPRTRRSQPVGEDIERLRFNRASRISTSSPTRCSAARRAQAKARAEPGSARPSREAAGILVQLIAPMMPHLAEECWAGARPSRPRRRHALAGARSGAAGRGHDHAAGAGQRQEARRCDNRPRRGSRLPIEAAVLALDAVQQALEGKPPRKIIVVPQRIVNVVA